MVHKIYGVLNLIDWTVNIKAGKATLRVHFTGGATTARGRVPATYATSDPVKQAIIEKSDYFKSRHIFVVDSMEVPDDAATVSRKAQRAAREAAKAAAVEVSGMDKNPKDEEPSQSDDTDEPAGDPVGEPGEPGIPDVNAEQKAKGEVPEAITVSSLDDAKEYLNEHFSIPKSQLRSRAAIEERAKEHGVVFFFKNA